MTIVPSTEADASIATMLETRAFECGIGNPALSAQYKLAAELVRASLSQERIQQEPSAWMDEARQIAAQCWCDEETKDRVMDPVLAEAVARRIAAWMQTGAQHATNEEYWRDRALPAEERIQQLEAELSDANFWRER